MGDSKTTKLFYLIGLSVIVQKRLIYIDCIHELSRIIASTKARIRLYNLNILILEIMQILTFEHDFQYLIDFIFDIQELDK